MFNGFYHALNAIGYNHPIHPALVSMPIGLVVGAFVLLLAAIVFRKPNLAVSARHVMILAFLFLIVTVAAGVVDWMHFYSGVWLFPIKVKVGLASLLFVLMVLAIILGAILKKPTSSIVVVVYALCFFTTVGLGYFGGNLVFGGRTLPLPAKYHAGQTIYSMNCSGCHPYGGNAIKPRSAILGSDKLDTLPKFVHWLRNARPPMPKFLPSRISDAQAQQLYQYLTHLHD